MTHAQQPTVGLMLFASARFRNLGEGTARGPYHERKMREAEATRSRLSESVRVVFPGIIYDGEDCARALRIFNAEGVDCVAAEFMSWSEDAAWIGFLRDAGNIPILFTHTLRQEVGFSNTENEDDFIEFFSAGGLVGTLEASGSIPRIGRDVSSVVGDAGTVQREIVQFAGAARLRSRVRKASIGLVGSYNEIMWSTYVDPYVIHKNLGPTVHFIQYSDLAAEIETVSEADTADYTRRLAAQHIVLSDVDPAKFAASARASLALARIAERMRLDIMVLNDVDHALFRAIGLRPGFYPQWFNDNDAVLVPEGDIGGGLATYLLKQVSGGHVNYIEPFYIDRAAGTFAAGHAGPNDHTDPRVASRVKIARDVRFAKTKYRHAGAPFAWIRFSPGEKTMVHVSENNGCFKLVCALIDCLDGEHFLASYSHGVFRPRIPVDAFFGRIIQISTTQHFAIVDGNWIDSLRRAGELLQMDFNVIANEKE